MPAYFIADAEDIAIKDAHREMHRLRLYLL
jgi:hypothetical protein